MLQIDKKKTNSVNVIDNRHLLDIYWLFIGLLALKQQQTLL